MSEQTIDGFAFDNGDLCDAVRDLLLASSAAQWVTITPGAATTEFSAESLPVSSWSTGEHMLWDYAASLAGRGSVNLGQLAGFFRGNWELSEQIFDVFAAALTWSSAGRPEHV